jgi:ABC-type glycerol-3-phosphate transport system substrate-binding protein
MDTGRRLRQIDVSTRSWGEDIELPMRAHNVFQGGGDYSIVFSDGSSLFGVETETGETARLLSWVESDISPEGLNNITILPDGRVMCTVQTWDRTSGMSSFELIILSKVPYESRPQRTIITLATVWLDWNLRSAIVNFNRTNDTYRINVIDYSEFNTDDDWSAGLTRLTTEIISGRVPDILDVSNLPFKQYVARGLFENLYPFIDSDPRLSRGDLMESIFRATEINGGLYQIFPTFSISTMMGNPSVVGSGTGWNMSEFVNVLRAHPRADVPIGMWLTKSAFLNQAVSLGMDEYVDWSAGMCYFDSVGFVQLLEFANTFPDEISFDREDFIDESELIANGRQIMMMTSVSDFQILQMYRALFGGDIVFKGFPTENRSGNTISINSGLALTSSSSNKEGAWEFMRTIITADYQRSNTWGFSTNRRVFDERLDEAMKPRTYIDEFGNEVEMSNISWGWGNITIEIFAMTQAEANQILALIDSVSGVVGFDESLMNIINEGAAEFFSGRRSAQDAARVIQSRASIFVAEQS